MTPKTAPNLTTPHGFFTRNGGVSDGIYASLNCGPGSGDDRARVAENRARVAAHFGANPARLHTLYQIHSAQAFTVADLSPEASAQGDALVTNQPGLVLGVLTADCAPVLFHDANARVIAAAHAGWKGAFGGIIESTLERMEALGASRTNTHAAIGPCIAQASYEVGPEFIERLVQEAQENTRFFATAPTPGKAFFDLKNYVKSRLEASGITNIYVSPHDTCAEEAAFFSFRRATLRKEGAYGRQISCIMLEE